MPHLVRCTKITIKKQGTSKTNNYNKICIIITKNIHIAILLVLIIRIPIFNNKMLKIIVFKIIAKI